MLFELYNNMNYKSLRTKLLHDYQNDLLRDYNILNILFINFLPTNFC